MDVVLCSSLVRALHANTKLSVMTSTILERISAGHLRISE